MTEPDFKRSVARGIAWVGLASSLVALFDLVALALILNFWVSAQEFGAVSIVVTAFGALQLAAELGLPAAIVGRADPDDDRLSTIFWIGILAGLAEYGLVFAAAPLIARAHGEAIVGPLFRVAGIVLLIRPLYTTHQALLRRSLRFPELSAVRMAANAVELCTKVGSALAGAGVWCFALGSIARELVYAIGVPLRARWRPRRVLRPRLVRPDFRFGMRSTGGELLFQLYSNLDYQVVAYAFGTTSVGIYRAAKELVLEPVRFVSNVVTVVAFPTFARLRDDRPAVVEQYVAFTRQNLAAVLGLLSVVVVAGEDVLGVLLGAQYAAAADAARILAIVGVFRALSHLGPPLLDGLGRPDQSLRYHVTAALVLSVAFVAATHLGETFFAVSVAWAVAYPIAFAVLMGMVFTHLEVSVFAYLRRVGRLVLCIVAAAGAGLVAHHLAAELRAGVRLALSAGVMLGMGATLLALYEGFSPRAIVRALRR
ncbi:MAG TPA: oligosaccharide flippase family protein [Kofleriaceae bacterium]|nr:oligosaccharide flippase family protein [Kofleriaceae bacterium]